MEQKEMHCLVLDAVQGHSLSIMEILSMLKKTILGTNEDQLVNALIGSLSFLLTANYVRIFEGNNFAGEETALDNFEVNVELIMGYVDDWKKLDYTGVIYKIAITEEGIGFFARSCRSQ
ncbi:hypothetical protein SAMN04488109_3787 [Chryseolinea serpens]|uniref:Uncharacterized protein n=1 Tax=Chryseolinea serpens TaxID=947013 RepID=A0A1M5S7C8_9BACT|nr:hypothetical protein [Chryseolinea serpens]SHH34391.1 hypothetical protein SAMN04488109_3787 [Chryseolinea serpens]